MTLFGLGLLMLGAQSAPAAQGGQATAPEPISRGLLRELTRQPRLAGTSGSRWGARFVARKLEEAGWQVEIDEREVLLSLPRRIVVAAYAGEETNKALFERRERFDPDAAPCGYVPPFNAWSASGVTFAPVVDAGYGLRSDFERLQGLGVELKGTIALARYGRCYRGIKAQLAEEFGCAGVLLFNDTNDSGAAKGDTWPVGPWKPDSTVERGSIAPMAKAPGDPSTPGWASCAPGEPGRRLISEEYDAALPKILCTPIPYSEARVLLAGLAEVTTSAKVDGEPQTQEALGPGPIHVQLGIWQPRDLRTIYNVIGTLPGRDDGWAIAGNHRDAWVRGANDAGSGTVALLRAAQIIGERARLGFVPRNTLKLAFWDAEETGLVGSTEWAEAHADELREHALIYLNADTAVSGTKFRGAAGTPGVLGTLQAGLEKVQQAEGGGSLWDSWTAAAGENGPQLGLPGSGSDYTVFLHHLNLPIVDLSLGGSSGGQYHTQFDCFAQVDRFLDPTWVGHELAGQMYATLLLEFAERGRNSFSEAEATLRMAKIARSCVPWLGAERSQKLADAFEATAKAGGAANREPFYQRLASASGLQGRHWYHNRLWAPGLETGYSAETFPTLRFAAILGDAALDFELNSLLEALSRELPSD
ncbi:MAG: N-acetylated-alpha-linked acidic dipeptidase [Candidatus Paceibacteria bacterium]|jgi:N-acetylated-alpha-linked acidic dipeptidase